jgi:hypothetical protein
MQPRPLFLAIVIVLLASLPAGSAGASGPGPQHALYPPTPSAHAPAPAAPLDVERFPGQWGRPAGGSLQAAATTAPGVAIGQPGLVYRYAQTFGESGVPYFADTSHLNFPIGVGTDGDNVWITEEFGHRALKYSSSGTSLATLGEAGSMNGPLGEAHDVAVDAGGNTWVLSGGEAVKFSPSGEELARTWRDDDPNTHFWKAAGIAFDAAGNVYISDGGAWWSRDDGHHRI